jgi:hypothetical protein
MDESSSDLRHTGETSSETDESSTHDDARAEIFCKTSKRITSLESRRNEEGRHILEYTFRYMEP